MNVHHEKAGAVPPDGILADSVLRSLKKGGGGFAGVSFRKPLGSDFIRIERRAGAEKHAPVSTDEIPLAPLPRNRSLVVAEAAHTDAAVPIQKNRALVAADSAPISQVHRVTAKEIAVPPIFSLPTITMSEVIEQQQNRKPDIKETELEMARTPGLSRLTFRKEFPVVHLGESGEVAAIRATKDLPPWIRAARKEEQKKMRRREARGERREFFAWKERRLERQARITLMKERVRAALQREEARRAQKEEVREMRRKKRAFEVRKMRLAKLPAKNRTHEIVRQTREDLRMLNEMKLKVDEKGRNLYFHTALSAGVLALFGEQILKVISVAPLSGANLLPFLSIAVVGVTLVTTAASAVSFGFAAARKKFFAERYNWLRGYLTTT